jgi:cyclic-di-AMP phosphodiesterase PgpH
MGRIGENLLATNLILDLKITQANRVQAAENAAPIFRQLKKGKVIVRRGDEISAADLAQIQAIRKYTPGGISSTQFLAFSLLMAFILFIYGFFLRNHNAGSWEYVPLASLCALILGINILALRVVGFAGESILHNLTFLPLAHQDYFYYLMPFAFGAMNVALLSGQRSALLFLVFYGPLAGQMVGLNIYNLSYVLVTNLVAIGAVRKIKQRIEIIGSGLKIGVAAVVMFLFIQWSKQSNPGLLDWSEGISLSFLSGLLNAGLLAFTLPLLEGLFKLWC